MRWIKILLGTLIFTIGITAGQAQETCTAFIQKAIETVQTSCADLEDNQVCYGNRFVNGGVAVQAINTQFLEPGNMVATVDLQEYELQPFDVELDSWGIAVARIVPDDDDDIEETQALQMIMFGSQFVWDASRVSPVQFEGTMTTSTNLLQMAGDFSTGIKPVDTNEFVLVNATEPNLSFIRVVDDRGNAGWIEAGTFTFAGDVFSLPIIDVYQRVDPTSYAPLQAIYLDRILGFPTCVDGPTSGVLIQTPNSTESTEVWINNVNIELNGTMYVTADVAGEMWVDVLAGEAELNEERHQTCTNGECIGVTIPAGTRAAFPFTNTYETLLPVLVPYDITLAEKLPLILLEETITPVPPLTPAEIESAQTE